MFDMMDYMDDMMRIENGWQMENPGYEEGWFFPGDEEDDEIPENND